MNRAPTEASASKGPRCRLQARALGVRRSGKEILQGVSFEAQSGELVAVLGPSGCGKSTLLLALAAFRPPTGGRLLLNGRDLVAERDAFRHRMGFVPQDDVVPPQLRVERVLHYAAELRLPELSEELRSQRVAGVLRTLDLRAQRRSRVDRLSGGQRKRVSIGVELLARPEILFADEPSSGLDPALEVQLMSVFRAMADAGQLVILTTHVMGSLRQVDRLVVLHAGRLVYSGTPADVRGYFGVEDFADIYHRLAEGEAAQWAERWRRRCDGVGPLGGGR